MFDDLSRFEVYLPEQAPESIEDLNPGLRIFRDETIEIWYSPMGNKPRKPTIWILGITPGWQQTRIAYAGAARAIQSGSSPHAAAATPKPQVAFAGSMRTNLVSMLDELGLPECLDVGSSADLFGSPALRTGSALKYPVFKDRKNYTGHAPHPLKHPALLEMINVVLAAELRTVGECLVVPLGNAAESILRYSIDQGYLDQQRVLFGLPHPSGANGHRFKQFHANKRLLRRDVRKWFENGA